MTSWFFRRPRISGETLAQVYVAAYQSSAISGNGRSITPATTARSNAEAAVHHFISVFEDPIGVEAEVNG